MKYYERYTSRREVVNKFGKIGFNFYRIYFITDDEEFVKNANYGLKNRFYEVDSSLSFENLEPNTLYEEIISTCYRPRYRGRKKRYY